METYLFPALGDLKAFIAFWRKCFCLLTHEHIQSASVKKHSKFFRKDLHSAIDQLYCMHGFSWMVYVIFLLTSFLSQKLFCVSATKFRHWGHSYKVVNYRPKT